MPEVRKRIEQIPHDWSIGAKSVPIVMIYPGLQYYHIGYRAEDGRTLLFNQPAMLMLIVQAFAGQTYQGWTLDVPKKPSNNPFGEVYYNDGFPSLAEIIVGKYTEALAESYVAEWLARCVAARVKRQTGEIPVNGPVGEFWITKVPIKTQGDQVPIWVTFHPGCLAFEMMPKVLRFQNQITARVHQQASAQLEEIWND